MELFKKIVLLAPGKWEWRHIFGKPPPNIIAEALVVSEITLKMRGSDPWRFLDIYQKNMQFDQLVLTPSM